MPQYDFEALKNHLIYVMKETQMKIGYTDNASSVNYPPASLCRLLGTQMDKDELEQALAEFSAYVRPALGELKISEYDGQCCLTVPAQGVRYVHEQVADSDFLGELIALIRSPQKVEIEDVIAVFRKYSGKVVVEEEDNEEYNYVLYFEDGQPDDFVYLVEACFGHVSYHRMTKADYQAEIVGNE